MHEAVHLERRFRQIVELAPHALVVVNQGGTILLVNSQVLRWFGYMREELIGQPVEMLIPERFRAPHPGFVAGYVQSPTLRPMGTGRDLYARRKDGSEFPVDISLSPLETEEGMQVVASIADMTERKRAETALRRSNLALGNVNEELEAFKARLVAEMAQRTRLEQRFRQLVELAPHAMVIVDRDGVMTLVNSQVLSWFGYAREELIGKPVDTLIPERFRTRHPEFLAGYINSPTLRPMGTGRELYGRRKDGTEFPVDISLSPVETAEGLQVIASIADVTANRTAESRLRQANAALEESDRSFRQLVELAPHAMVIVDKDGSIVLVNSQILAWFGYEREELLGQPVEMLIPERFRARHPEYLAGFVGAPTLRPMGTGRELYARRKDGSEFPVDISLSPVHAAEGLRVIASIADITESRNAQDRLRQAMVAVEAVNKEMQAFAYAVSHDLRAPLRAMVGFAQILQEDYGSTLDAGALDHLQRIGAAGQRMGELIDGLLSLSRITRGNLHVAEVNLTALADSVAQELCASELGLNVQFTVMPNLMAQGDARLLRLVLQNLLGNAWKFTSKAAQPKVEVGMLPGNGSRTFYVRDNGAGFDMAHYDKLFGAFQRLHAATDFPGTGIGLATVQRIIARHGGRLWAEAQPDQGATFYFTLA